MISSLTILVIIAGWLVNAFFTRKHEIFKMRLQKRASMLESTCSLLTEISLQFNKKLPISYDDRLQLSVEFQKLKKNIFLYGYNDEMVAYREIAFCVDHIDNPEVTGNRIESSFTNALEIFRTNVRYEYDFPLSNNQLSSIVKRRKKKSSLIEPSKR